MHSYGVVNNDGIHVDVSKSEKGAKQHATRNGYKKVSVRYNGGLIADIIAIKVAGRWVKPCMRVTI